MHVQMTTDEIKKKYLDFFTSSPRDHKQIPSASLVLENDPTTLFTSAGMQPLVPYLLGEPHPLGKRLVNSQPSIRTQDIEEIGDSRHTTYFEMLGNWSLGDYFKKEQIPWIWEFLTEVLALPPKKLYVSVFAGNGDVPRDEESYKIWRKLGVASDHIFAYGEDKNWWSRAGTPAQMPAGEIGGPTSEIFYEFTGVAHNKKFGNECHPNCDCGRFMEIGNSVFMVYKKTNRALEELPNKNVDFGGGLERITAAVNDDPDIFHLPVFGEIVKHIEDLSGKKYGKSEKETQAMRIVADHMHAAVAMAQEGLEPSNKLQGYIMRRLIRRSVVKMNTLMGKTTATDFGKITQTKPILNEVDRFSKTLQKGLREFEKLPKVDGEAAFNLYQTYGFPLELTLELAHEKGQKLDPKDFKEAFKKHQEMSRTQSAGKFKGGLADVGGETTKLHTVTHLLHAALRRVLGNHVSQKGSNITASRLRFDFTHHSPLTSEEIQKVENLINDQIKKSLPVSYAMMSLKEAKAAGALAFFTERYGDKVKVYTIGDDDSWFSREVCGGPHVTNLSEIKGRVKITKEKSASAGVRRVYAKIIT